VTRTLVKRQIRAAVRARAHRLADGIWLLRLRAGYEAARYPSAASSALRRAVRDELDRLLEACAAPPPEAA
jgi:ribonuclease P protein component